MSSFWVWTISRQALKFVIKLIIYTLDFVTGLFCTRHMINGGHGKQRLTTDENGRSVYTNDMLSFMLDPTNNPISNPLYDIDKYTKVCAGVFFICEGEVLLLQRHSKNNDLTFDIPGGNVDMEDFPDILERMKKKDKKNNKNKKHKKHSTPISYDSPSYQEESAINNKNNNASDSDSDSSPPKRKIHPLVPLYDSFYMADLLNQQFQQLGLQSWQVGSHIQREHLEHLHEQSIRHMYHGFGFESGVWAGASREAQEETNTFPTEITPLAVFNIYRGWYTDFDDILSPTENYEDRDNALNTLDDDDDDANDYDEQQPLTKDYKNDHSVVDIDQTVFSSQSQQRVAKHADKTGRVKIDQSLLSSGKIIGPNFRRYTLYLVSITPEQRNYMSSTIHLSEEHVSYGWFPICLLSAMQNANVSVFKHFRLHPWLISFIEQYNVQFKKLSHKRCWVGFLRHFGQSAKDYTNQYKKQEHKQSVSVNDDDISLVSITSPSHQPTLKTKGKNNTLDTVIIDEDKDGKKKKDKDGKKKKKDGKKKKDKDGKKKKKSGGGDDDDDDDDDDVSDDNIIDCDNDDNNNSSNDTDDNQALSLSSLSNSSPQHKPQSNISQVKFDPEDVFINTFLPLVHKYMNPNVYT